MNELAIYEDESQMRIATETIDLYLMQIKSMENEVARIKETILTAMQKYGVGITEIAGAKFQRIAPEKKVLKETEALNYLIEKDLLQDFQILDTKKVMTSFPDFVEKVETTEYLKITKLKEKKR